MKEGSKYDLSFGAYDPAYSGDCPIRSSICIQPAKGAAWLVRTRLLGREPSGRKGRLVNPWIPLTFFGVAVGFVWGIYIGAKEQH